MIRHMECKTTLVNCDFDLACDVIQHVHMHTLHSHKSFAVFQCYCNAKRHALYKHVCVQLFNSGFSVTTTDS